MVAALRKQIEALKDESTHARSNLTMASNITHMAYPPHPIQRPKNSTQQHRLHAPEALLQKLKAYEQACRDQREKNSYQFPGQVDSAVSKFYRQGCPGTSYKFTKGMLQSQAQAANQTDDLSQWFEQSESR